MSDSNPPNLDTILDKVWNHGATGKTQDYYQENAKQEILHLIATEIIGKDEVAIDSEDEETFAQNDLRKAQREKLKEL